MRAVTILAVFFVGMNAWALLMQSTGVAAAVGLTGVNGECPNNPTQSQIETIPDCTVENQASRESIQAGTSTGSTLFGMYNVVTSQVMGVLYVVFPALNLLARAGVPGSIIGFMSTIYGMLMTITALSYLRGYDL